MNATRRGILKRWPLAVLAGLMFPAKLVEAADPEPLTLQENTKVTGGRNGFRLIADLMAGWVGLWVENIGTGTGVWVKNTRDGVGLQVTNTETASGVALDVKNLRGSRRQGFVLHNYSDNCDAAAQFDNTGYRPLVVLRNARNDKLGVPGRVGSGDYIQFRRNEGTGAEIHLGKVDQKGDMWFLMGTNGPIIKDRVTGAMYRLKVENGVLGIEPVSE